MKRSIKVILGRREILVQLSQIIRDMLQLQYFVHLPALTQRVTVDVQSVGASSQLARYLGQRAKAFSMEVVQWRRASAFAAILGGFGASAAIGVVWGWS